MKFSSIFIYIIALVLVGQTSGFFLRRPFGLGLGPRISPFLGKRDTGYDYSTTQLDSSVNQKPTTVPPEVTVTVDALSAQTPSPIVSSPVEGFHSFATPPHAEVETSVSPTVENGTDLLGVDFENGTDVPQQPIPFKRAVHKRFLTLRAVPVPVIEKRSVLNMTENETVCSLSTGRSVLTCRRKGLLVECGVVSNLTSLGHFELKGENFRMLPEGSMTFNVSSIEDVQRVDIGSWKRDSEFNDYTMVQSGHRVLLSLYVSESVQESGFRFVDRQCWRNYVDLLKQFEPSSVRLSLNIAQA